MRGDAERQTNMLLAVTPDSFIPEGVLIPAGVAREGSLREKV